MRKLAEGTDVETKWFILMLGIIFLVFSLSYLPFVMVNQVQEIFLYLYVLLLVLVVSEKSVNYIFKFYLSLFFFITLLCVKNDPCYTKPHLHVFAYVINWTSVVVNPVIYVVMQRSYQVSITLFLNKFQNFSL